MNKELNLKIIDLLRESIKVEDMDIEVSKYCSLGYLEDIKEVSYIDKIIRSADIKQELQNTFKLIEKENKELEGVFVYQDLDNEIQNETLYKILSLIKDRDIEKNEWRTLLDDALDKIYESSKFKGEASTPTYLNKLGIGLIEPKEGSFCDATCGIGKTLTEADNFAKEYGNYLELYGQEITLKSWAICKIRLFLNGSHKSEIKLGNTLSEPLFIENNELKTFDNIMMNFPFSMNWKAEKEAVEKDIYNRFLFGKPPVSNGEWLFISHMIKSLKENGKAVAITSSGTLFRGSEESIRKNILSLDCIESVISLPGVMTVTAIPINMIVINMNKSEDLKNKILFINAETMFENVSRSQKILTEEHINTIIDIYKNKKEIDEISSIVDIKEIEESNLLASKNVLKTEMDSEELGKIRFKKEQLEKLKQCETLGKIGDFYRGINVIGDNVKEDKDGEYKIINFSDVKDGEIDIESLTKYTIKNNARVESYIAQEGDILISSRGANTKVCVIPPHNEKVVISQNFIGIRLKAGNDPQYIKEFLESPLGQFLISNKQLGTSIVTINPKDLKKLPIMLVDSKDQEKIIKDYKKEQEILTKQIEEIQKKLEDSTLNLYRKMGILDTFEIL